MVSQASVDAQLKKLHYNRQGWGHGEVNQLADILLEGEEIYELVNGIYEGGFAMLVATDIRMLLIDKKPLNFLTVEDLRFDMISELDYSHRLIGAHVNVSAGSKNLKFRSYNQPRLRKLITHVQHCMADGKKKQANHQTDQNQHLEQINQQLQEYLVAQHRQQEQLHKQLKKSISGNKAPKIKPEDAAPLKPSAKLADYLFAQSLLARHKKEQPTQQAEQISATPIAGLLPSATVASDPEPLSVAPITAAPAVSGQGDELSPQVADMYAEGMNEIYGRHSEHQQAQQAAAVTSPAAPAPQDASSKLIEQYVEKTAQKASPLDVNPISIAYSKLPLALRNRKFGSPSFHAHSRADEILQVAQAQKTTAPAR